MQYHKSYANITDQRQLVEREGIQARLFKRETDVAVLFAKMEHKPLSEWEQITLARNIPHKILEDISILRGKNVPLAHDASLLDPFKPSQIPVVYHPTITCFRELGDFMTAAGASPDKVKDIHEACRVLESAFVKVKATKSPVPLLEAWAKSMGEEADYKAGPMTPEQVINGWARKRGVLDGTDDVVQSTLSTELVLLDVDWSQRKAQLADSGLDPASLAAEERKFWDNAMSEKPSSRFTQAQEIVKGYADDVSIRTGRWKDFIDKGVAAFDAHVAKPLAMESLQWYQACQGLSKEDIQAVTKGISCILEFAKEQDPVTCRAIQGVGANLGACLTTPSLLTRFIHGSAQSIAKKGADTLLDAGKTAMWDQMLKLTLTATGSQVIAASLPITPGLAIPLGIFLMYGYQQGLSLVQDKLLSAKVKKITDNAMTSVCTKPWDKASLSRAIEGLTEKAKVQNKEQLQSWAALIDTNPIPDRIQKAVGATARTHRILTEAEPLPFARLQASPQHTMSGLAWTGTNAVNPQQAHGFQAKYRVGYGCDELVWDGMCMRTNALAYNAVFPDGPEAGFRHMFEDRRQEAALANRDRLGINIDTTAGAYNYWVAESRATSKMSFVGTQPVFTDNFYAKLMDNIPGGPVVAKDLQLATALGNCVSLGIPLKGLDQSLALHPPPPRLEQIYDPVQEI